MTEDTERCNIGSAPLYGSETKCGDEITRKLKMDAVNAVNIYLIRLLEVKQFCLAQTVGEALKKVV